jgi:ATP/maltotriose-dependent transcriptional regulator MalT
MVACLGFAAVTAETDPPRAAVLVLLAALLAYGALRLGGVPSAFAALRRNDLGSAKRLLDQTSTRFLNADCRAKYAWVEAALAEASGDLTGARDKLVEALTGDALARLPERGIALATLAAVHHRLGEVERARELLTEAQQTSASPDVQRLVEKLRAELLAG